MSDSRNIHSNNPFDVTLKNAPVQILLVEDNPGDVVLLNEFLKRGFGTQYKLTTAATLSAAAEHITSKLADASPAFDIILSDLNLPDSHGLETFEAIYNLANNIPIVLLTAFGNNDTALEAIKLGAQDFLNKDTIGADMLQRIIYYAIERNHLRRHLKSTAELLHRSEARVLKIVQENVDGILIVNVDGIVKFFNPAAEHLLGKSFDELSETHLGLPIACNQPAELNLVSENGSMRSVEMHTGMIDWDNEQMYLVSLRDITSSKAAEEIHFRNESLENIKKLAGAIAHEFSQPLQILDHTFELSKTELDFEKRKEVCQRSINRVINLVRKLRTIVTIENQPYLSSEILDLSASSNTDLLD